MGKIKTTSWDAADYLKTDKKIVAYLEAVLEDGDPALVAAALGDVARAKGMTQIAQAAGLGRESLYKALSPEGNPELATVLKVVRALGLKLSVTPPNSPAARPVRPPRRRARRAPRRAA
jgi:probable addiction module antidote protein